MLFGSMILSIACKGSGDNVSKFPLHNGANLLKSKMEDLIEKWPIVDNQGGYYLEVPIMLMMAQVLLIDEKPCSTLLLASIALIIGLLATRF